MPAPHRIARQIVEVDVDGDEATGMRVQQQVAAFFRDVFPVRLSRILAGFDDTPYNVVFDRIEIDAGAVGLADLESALTIAIDTEMSQVFRDIDPAAPEPSSAKADGQPAWRSYDGRRAVFAALDHYLRHGRLPWWYELADRTFAAVVADEFASAPPVAGEVAGLTAVLASRPAARLRLLEWFPVAVARMVLAAVAPPVHELVVRALALPAARIVDPAQRTRLEGLVMGAALSTIGIAAAPTTPAADDARRLLDVALGRLGANAGAASPESGPDGAARAMVDTPPAEESGGGTEAAPDPAGFVVANAGIVLLHPFLPRFLAKVGVASGDTLHDPDRALLLVHHLATGAPAAEEDDLVFAKVLCGLPPEEPARRTAEVTDNERDEARTLLQAALDHWGALGSTTPDGLRGNFLTRPGKVEFGGAENVLRLEWQSYDVMLDRLPWGLHLVRLPWMAKFLRVEWSP